MILYAHIRKFFRWLTAILLIPVVGYSQPFANDWIVPTQQYYKITTADDGIYRISYDDLIDAGIPVSAINPRNIQIFHRGNEQAILVQGQNTGTISPGDYIEFYGKRNDGWQDTELYVSSDAHKNLYHSLYSDSTAYFLTWTLNENGKRINTFRENNVLGLPAEPYHLNKKIELFSNQYSTGLHYPLGVPGAESYLSAFDYGEGWTGTALRQGQYLDILFEGLDQAVMSGPQPVIQILLAGRNNLNHNVTIEVGPDQANLREIRTMEFRYHYDTLIFDTLEWSDISSGALLCRINVNDLGTVDRVSVSFAKLQFADGFDHNTNQQKFYYIPPTMDNRSYIELDNVPQGAEIYDITDENTVEKIEYNSTGSSINAVINNDSGGRKLLVTSQRMPHSGLRTVTMPSIQSNADFYIISHKDLRLPTGSYNDPVQAYADYRASESGGGYTTGVIDIDELYNAFTYGEVSSLAIRRLAQYLDALGDPKYIFIIGKGLTPNYNFYRNDPELQTVKDLVPTAGYPGSDVLFTSGINGATHESGIAIGRIASKTPSDVVAYLEKVKEKEALAYSNLWQKQLLHLSGGRDLIQQSLFQRYVQQLELVAEGPYLGGSVSTISKQNTGSTEFINVSEQVNAGKMLLTFFGHSATESTDIDIGLVSDPSFGYDNHAKYPLMYVNGCIAGDMFNTGLNGFGEDWVNTPDKGAVGFIAHSGAGLSTLLKRYADIFYEVAFSDSVFHNKSIGEIQSEIGQRYLLKYSGERNISQVQQMALQADPALHIFGADLPDYEVSSNNIFELPEDGQAINVFSDFDLGIVLRNFGITQPDSIDIAIVRKLEDGTVLQQDTLLMSKVYFQDTLLYKVNAAGVASVGENIFEIHIDPLGKIEELSEVNNYATYEIRILGDLTKNVLPYEYAIVNQREVTLISQALDVLSGGRDFVFELDSTADFSNPLQTFNSSDQVIARWTVDLFENLPQKDTLAFYWRTQFSDQSVDSLRIWDTSSFTYINEGNTGWAMIHRDQFAGSRLENIVLNETSGHWEFEKFETSLLLRTFGDNHSEYDFSSVQLKINEAEYIFPTRLCTDNSMNFVAFDKATTIPYFALGRPFILDRKSCGRQPQVVNNMLNSEIVNDLRIEEYINAIDDGDFVLAFSIGTVSYDAWPASTIDKLSEIGVDISVIQNLQEGEPVIILGKKGMSTGDALIITADYSGTLPADQQEISMDEVINGQAVAGKITSPRIGPALSWSLLTQQIRSSELPVADVFSLNVYGINRNNDEILLFQNVQSSQLDLNSIDAGIFPYLRLELLLGDDQNLTPAQLHTWVVNYEGVPEGILTYKRDQPLQGIEIQEGEVHKAFFEFENLSTLAYPDSLAVRYEVFNNDSRQREIDTIRIKAPGAQEKIEFSLDLETLELPGNNDLSVFANPYLMHELDYNNNTLSFKDYLQVVGDKTNPILEVTVDGEFIMDGDIVSPSPLIVMRLKDENKVMLKQDTLDVNMYLNKQCKGCAQERVSFSSPNVVWTPATEEKDFTVEYKPDQLEDGIYALRVEASDASGNASGSEPYSVNFEIVNESQITNFFPYPNPFSSRTHFVFTLTGSEIPEDIIIQIMTVNGTVVREITMDEIGPIRIGHNKTQYAWDGHDEYGDQLANGVYLYTVKIYTNGEEMKHRSTSADKAFKNGFGKIYLLR
jgi:hypothetical protein